MVIPHVLYMMLPHNDMHFISHVQSSEQAQQFLLSWYMESHGSGWRSKSESRSGSGSGRGRPERIQEGGSSHTQGILNILSIIWQWQSHNWVSWSIQYLYPPLHPNHLFSLYHFNLSQIASVPLESHKSRLQIVERVINNLCSCEPALIRSKLQTLLETIMTS